MDVIRRIARARMLLPLSALLLAVGCGGKSTLLRPVNVNITGGTPHAAAQIGFPAIATKNTTRVAGSDPVADAAGVALAVYPSQAPGTHPQVVTVAPTDDWEAALASAVLMAPPIKAPILLSGGDSLPNATADALNILAPTGSGSTAGAQGILVGDVPDPGGMRVAKITGGGPFALAAAIDRFASAAAGKTSPDVIIASADAPAYAMPAAGLSAETGAPILFVTGSTIPSETRQALLAHQSPHIYVLGPASVIPSSVSDQLKKYGKVKRVGSDGSAANSVTFAGYRDPPCAFGQPCVHVPGSFGWALRSPGHGYVLINSHRTLDAAAAAPLSATGTFAPLLLVDEASKLPTPVLNYFLNYATPGYTQEGPTAAVYNHGWVIGDPQTISVSVQAEMDTLLEAVPQK
jgi:ell wall binding domain 2 (CWB2)